MSMQTATELHTVSLTVTEEVTRAYAELTNDFNPIHLDAEFAAKTPMGRPIAHGTLSLCLIWQCLERNFGAEALADLDLQVRFIQPVFIGDVITAGCQATEAAPDQYDVSVHGQDGSKRIVGSVTLNASYPTGEGDQA